MANQVSIDALRPGMVILHITKQNGPVKIRKSGLVTSETMVQGLAEMGVLEVEIDPDQTVEIAPEPQKRTQTQALLRGQYDKGASFDHALSDQFNRSLFLPTVQGLPSMWQVYTRQAVLVVLLISGGFGIGFTTSTAKSWWPSLWPSLWQHKSVAQPSVTPPQETAQIASEATIVEKTPEQTGTDSQISSSDDHAIPVAANQSTSNTLDIVTTEGNKPQFVDPRENEQDPFSQGQVLNEESDTRSSVSPELLARFNEAVAELERVDGDLPSSTRSTVTIRNDVQRLDQLPVRLLTRLPNMSFNAHMYASNPSDRWVRVNGEQLGEGDWITNEVQIVNIEAQRVILAFEDEVFSMAALTDW